MMDTSKEFILMCEKAVEIQKEWKYELGDFIRETGFGNVMIINAVCEALKKTKHLHTWLPRQDQLQEMVYKIPRKDTLLEFWGTWIDRFEEFRESPCAERFDGGNLFLKSMEQLWLAFVMKEKYNKVWDGKEWK